MVLISKKNFPVSQRMSRSEIVKLEFTLQDIKGINRKSINPPQEIESMEKLLETYLKMKEEFENLEEILELALLEWMEHENILINKEDILK